MKNLSIITLALLSLMTIACSKDTKSDKMTNTEILTAHKWKITDEYMERYLVSNDSLLSVSQYFALMKDCVKDDELIFFNEGQVLYDLNEFCTEMEPSSTSGLWYLDEEDNTLYFEFDDFEPVMANREFDVVELTEDRILISTLKSETEVRHIWFLEYSKVEELE